MTSVFLRITTLGVISINVARDRRKALLRSDGIAAVAGNKSDEISCRSAMSMMYENAFPDSD